MGDNPLKRKEGLNSKDESLDPGPHVYRGGAAITDHLNGKLKLGNTTDIEDTDSLTRSHLAEPQVTKPVEFAIFSFKDLTEAE